jgi:hypothetical protein
MSDFNTRISDELAAAEYSEEEINQDYSEKKLDKVESRTVKA